MGHSVPRRAYRLCSSSRPPALPHLRRFGSRRLHCETLEERTLLTGDTLLITEFMAANDTTLVDGDGNCSDWIEIHNPTASPVDLGGWYLSDDPDQLRRWPLSSVSLAAGAFQIIFASGQPVNDYVDGAGNYHTNFKLSAGGESVLLVDATAAIVHGFVNYPPQATDVSHGLQADLVTEADFTWPTPGGPADDPARHVLITEIMYHPVNGSGVEDLREEYIELLNRGMEPVNLAGWQLADGVDFTLPDVTVSPGEYLVVAANTAALMAKYPGVAKVVGGWTGRLSNSSEEITLRARDSRLIDTVRYADSGDWADRQTDPDYGVGWVWDAPHDGAGPSLELVNADFANGYAHNWRASARSGGTPGAANSVASADIAPAIFDVAHAPIIPKSTDEVHVSARLADEDQNGIAGFLFWRASTLDPGPFTQVPMADDGAHGDGVAGDALFGAVIPPQPDGAIVEFYIRAVDAGGLVRTLPGPTNNAGAQAANMLYQVDDVDRSIDVPFYRSIMTAREWDQFRTLDRRSDARMNATLVSTIGGMTEVRHNVGIRYRGSSTRGRNPTNNRINIPSDRPWLGSTEVNINAFRPQNQVAGSTLFAMGDLPVASAWPVRMTHNGIDLTGGGYYTHLEVLNGDWAARHFPLDGSGNVYRGRRAGEGPPGGWGAGLVYFGEDPAPYVSYVKGSNASERDWSDVIRLTDILNNASNETYLEELSQVADVDEWLRTMAMIQLAGYGEASLLTGDADGDDYAMYRGIEDPRFLMVPYDLDDMFAYLHGLFSATGVPALNRLLSHPDVLPRYYAELLDLMDNALTEDKIRPALEQALGNVEPASTIDGMVGAVRDRIAYVRTLIPVELTAVSGLPTVGGLPHTTETTSGALTGFSHAVQTRSVQVAGRAAAWDPRAGQWSIADVPLRPGINHVLVQAFDADGREIDRTAVDIWRDTGTTHDIAGTIATNTTWTANAGPYRVTGNVTVVEGATLTIEPGTSVYFAAGAQLSIYGQLLAEGAARDWIRFTRVPGTDATWAGVQFVDTHADNRIAYAVVEYGVTDHGMIGLTNARGELDHLLLDHTGRRRIQAINSSLVVRNSTFTDLFGPDEPPSSDNVSEQIHGVGIAAGGQMIIENNWFGTTKGHNDVIDFSGPARPGPILQVLGNVFTGSGDEILDLGGDAYIEGNLFQHVHKDRFNVGSGEANVISTGDDDFDAAITVVRNVFQDVDHAVNLKRGTFMVFENNTVVGIPDDTAEEEFSAISFLIPGLDPPGKGAYLSGNIFADIPRRIFGHPDETMTGTGSFVTELEMHNTLIPPNRAGDQVGQRPGTILDLGSGNIVGDPCLIDSASDFRLRPGSPAVGTGPNGLDMGADISGGASIAGEPATITAATTATLTVGGPAITHYRFRMNDSGFGPETAVSTPIELSGLADGTYWVAVVGRNSAGVWQDEADATLSRTWTVDRQLTRLQISEVLARNVSAVNHEGTYPDLIELVNDGAAAIDLAGMRLSDTADDPTKFVFPSPTVLDPGEFLVLYADSNTRTSGLHLGFALNADSGEGVFLFDSEAAGGAMLDAVEFGIQLPDLSIGRAGQDGEWALTQPTFGSANVAQPTSDWSSLKINEWLANPETIFADDFIEIYNPQRLPVPLGGLFLTDSPAGWPGRSEIAALSFVGARGYMAFTADGNAGAGADHVDFRLSSTHEMIGLLDHNLNEIDKVIYYGQAPDVSQGRRPDGGDDLTLFTTPTPGRPNPRPSLRNLLALDPPGSLVYIASADAAIESFDDVHDYTIALDPGQTITLIIHPDETLRTRIELTGPDGTLLASVSAASPGAEGLIDSLAVAGAGTYAVTVRGVDGTIGDYSVQLILNAGTEWEAHSGPANDSMDVAQDLDGSLVTLALGSAERAVVLGGMAPLRIANQGPGVNTPDNENTSTLSADGLTLLFSSDRPGGAGDYDLYLATRPSTSDTFGNVVSLGAGVNTAQNETGPALSPDGLTLYFGSNRAGGFGSSDIYMATRAITSEPFGNVTNLGSGVNTQANDNNPTVSADGLLLLLNSNRQGSWGGQDIYMTTRARTSDPFGTAVRLTSDVNSSANESRPSLSADGLALYFHSDRAQGLGGHDLYVARRSTTSAAFGRAENLGISINSPDNERSPGVSHDGSTLLFESDRPGGEGNFDLYYAQPEADWYRFTLQDGQSATLAATALARNDVRLDLFDSNSNVLATGASAGNVDQVLSNFTDTTSDGVPDDYFVRVMGGLGNYSLLMTKDAGFDTGPSAAGAVTIQDLGPSGAVLGTLSEAGSDGSLDEYRFLANTGDILAITTLLPASGPGQFVNDLDVAVELYGPGHHRVAAGQDGSLTHLGVLAGTYTVRVLAENGTAGEYVLSVKVTPTGDMNLDGSVDTSDVHGFALALANPAQYEARYGLNPTLNGDIDGDGDLDFDDIDDFVGVISGGSPASDSNADSRVNGRDVEPFVDVLLSGSFNARADVNQDGAVNGLDLQPFVRAALAGSVQLRAPAGTLDESDMDLVVTSIVRGLDRFGYVHPESLRGDPLSARLGDLREERGLRQLHHTQGTCSTDEGALTNRSQIGPRFGRDGRQSRREGIQHGPTGDWQAAVDRALGDDGDWIGQSGD